MFITFGLAALFCIAVIVVLQMAHVTDKSFTDYSVANRSFGPFYQAMSFLNTWWPGGIFLAITGLAASGGVISFYFHIIGLAAAVILQSVYPLSIGWAGGLTSGVIALIINAAIYASCAVLRPHSATEAARVDGLFALTNSRVPSASTVGALALKPRRA
jgi:hypothetical protein